jgi:hypothetical protein
MKKLIYTNEKDRYWWSGAISYHALTKPTNVCMYGKEITRKCERGKEEVKKETQLCQVEVKDSKKRGKSKK